ncbi:MAG: BMP family ABC transporter substrate-binding protein, partial [Acidimicrobiales bacterium]
MEKDEKTGLYLPEMQGVPRRRALRLGVIGLGGVALGGPLLAACGDDDDESTSTGDDGSSGDDGSGDDGGDDGGGDGGGGGQDSIKAHFVYIGPPDDNGWTQEHDRARLEAEAALGGQLETAFTPNIGFDASTTQLFQQLADDGNDIIFANTEYASLLSDVAAANPDTIFMECNGHAFTDNIFGYYVAHEVPAYLLGVAAAMLTDNG